MWSIYRFTYCSACMAMKFYVLKEDIHVQVKVVHVYVHNKHNMPTYQYTWACKRFDCHFNIINFHILVSKFYCQIKIEND